MKRKYLAIAAVAVGVIAASAFAIPAAVQDKSERKMVLRSYSESREYEGQGTFEDHLTFEAPLPSDLAKKPVTVYVGLHWALNGTGSNSGNTVDMDFTARLGGSSIRFASNHFGLRGVSGLDKTSAGAALKVDCPCEAASAAIDVDVSLRNPGGDAYSYRFTPRDLVVWWKPRDTDGDGIVQSAQWTPLPQYYWLVIGLGVALILAMAAARHSRADKMT